MHFNTNLVISVLRIFVRTTPLMSTSCSAPTLTNLHACTAMVDKWRATGTSERMQNQPSMNRTNACRELATNRKHETNKLVPRATIASCPPRTCVGVDVGCVETDSRTSCRGGWGPLNTTTDLSRRCVRASTRRTPTSGFPRNHEIALQGESSFLSRGSGDRAHGVTVTSRYYDVTMT